MFDPTTDTAMFLSGAFVLGLALGWALWKLGSEQQLSGAATETEFWQQRLNQARQEREFDKIKIEALEKERAKLADQIAAK